MRTPPGAIGDTETRVLLAVTAQTRPTTRSVATATGRSVTVVHKAIHRLGTSGLVAFEPCRYGTLRTRVRVVAREARTGG